MWTTDWLMQRTSYKNVQSEYANGIIPKRGIRTKFCTKENDKVKTRGVMQRTILEDIAQERNKGKNEVIECAKGVP